MNFKENILLAFAGLKANKMRAFLTMLGIIIGISSVIMITTMGTIVEKGLSGLVTDLGVNNLIEIYINNKDNASRAAVNDSDMLNDDMINQIKTRFSDEIQYVAFQESVGGASMRYKREDINMTVYGYNPDYLHVFNTDLIKGRYINDKDIEGKKYICVIPSDLAEKLYGSASKAVGNILEANVLGVSREFAIVGVYKYKQSTFGGVFSKNYDIHIPLTTARGITNSSPYYSWIDFTAYDGVDVIKFAEKLTGYVNDRYYKNNNSFEIKNYTMAEQLSSISQYVTIIQLVLSIIAGISLLVGGIGVMNIMLVSVTERTREIGVRKALGAPNSAIRIQFIVESVIICSIGGLVGILSGVLLGNLIGLFLKTSAIPSVGAIIIAVSFSMAIGVFFGYYPANRAAKLDPIESLRYE